MPAGRPPIYNTAEELEAAIEAYFNGGMKKRVIVVGKAPNTEKIEIEVPTITGLCYFLGFESRQAFYHLENNEKFSYTVKRARLRIENEYEEQMQTATSPSGPIFALKNFGWTDKQTIEHEGSKEKPVTFVLDERFTNS